MGSNYEIVYFAGTYWLHYMDESTEWKYKAIELNEQQLTEASKLETKQRLQMDVLLKSFLPAKIGE